MLIEIQDYSFTYAGSHEPVLQHIDLELQKGGFYLLTGPSGCGKSTLLRQLKPELAPKGKSCGKIFFDGKAPDTYTARETAESIGYVMQDPDSQIVTDKVWHELAFGPESLGLDSASIRLRVAEMASYFGIQNWFRREVADLSGGQKQLLNLAATMVMHPTLLILDEPTSQLDPIAASDFLATICKINRELGVTVLMTEHRLEEVFALADEVILMDEGKILYAGAPKAAGAWIADRKHGMFGSLPAPMQIALAYDGESREEIPLTVKEGRSWLSGKVNTSDGMENEMSVRSEQKGKETILQVKDVCFRYEKKGQDVLKNLSLELYAGEFYCILGGNGTGKSTALALLCRLYAPYRGKIRLKGRELKKYTDRELYGSVIGMVPQNPMSLFANKTVREELEEMLTGADDMESVARLCHLEKLLDRHPFDLSGGEQQRLALAKVLMLHPILLLMDEPTKGMDAGFKEEFAAILSELCGKGLTILMVSHDVEFCAQHADRCGLFFDGEIVSEGDRVSFFAGNTFYTTAANRMAGSVMPRAITTDDILERLKEIKKK